MKNRSLLFAFLVLLAIASGGTVGRRPQRPAGPGSRSAGPGFDRPRKAKSAHPPGPIDIAGEPIVKIVANVQPAVVNITAQETVSDYVTSYNQYFQLYRSPRKPHRAKHRLRPHHFRRRLRHHQRPRGRPRGEGKGSITLSSGSKYRAEIVSADDDADLALLKIEDTTAQFPYFDLSYTSPNLLGETVVALGSPAGYQNSVSHGILSALHRNFTVEDHTYNNLIQTDAAINPGNSGGPLIDLNGGLVGINSAKLAGTAIENIGFAIPNDVVIPWANDAMAVAKGLKPAAISTAVNKLDLIHKYLGITVKALSADDAAEKGLQTNGGLLITHIDEDSPAADAGLRSNMIIVMIGNRQITDEKSLPKELLQMQSGTNVRLQVITISSMGPLTIQRGGSVMLTAR